MTMTTRIVCAVLATAIAFAADMPRVKETTAVQVKDYPQLFIAGPDFRTAASVEVTAAPNKSGNPVQVASDAARASNGDSAAVAVVVGKVKPAVQPALNGSPGPDQRIGFKESWNSAQAWATMRGNGLPFLDMQTFGKGIASGTAAWNAKIVMPQNNGLYVTFSLPVMKVFNMHEGEGPSSYQGRVRVELLLNGHSVWTSEANRLNTLTGNFSGECTTDTAQPSVLTEFGKATGLNASDVSIGSSEKSVTLSLGQFAAAQEVEVSLVVRADSQTNRICCIKPVNGVDQSFCSGSQAQVFWSNAVEPVKFRTGPAL